MSEPRGIRNNNPTNIEWSASTQWQGLASPPSDGRFARFTDPQWGLRATLVILRNYQKRGLTTLRQMVSTWAPSVENNVENYLGVLVKYTGLRESSTVDLTDKDLVIKLLRGMVRVECGAAPKGTANGDWMDDSVYEAAWSLSKPMSKSKTVGGAAGAAAATVAGAVVEVAQSQMDVIIGAGSAWPKYAVAISTLVALCCIGVVIYSRLKARTEGIR